MEKLPFWTLAKIGFAVGLGWFGAEFAWDIAKAIMMAIGS